MIEGENHQFNDEWAFQYFINTFNRKLVCLICLESLRVMKEFNCRRHYEMQHVVVYEAAVFDDMAWLSDLAFLTVCNLQTSQVK